MGDFIFNLLCKIVDDMRFTDIYMCYPSPPGSIRYYYVCILGWSIIILCVLIVELDALFPAQAGCNYCASRARFNSYNQSNCPMLLICVVDLTYRVVTVTYDHLPPVHLCLVHGVWVYAKRGSIPSLLVSSVRDPRGPAPFLRIRAEYRDNMSASQPNFGSSRLQWQSKEQ